MPVDGHGISAVKAAPVHGDEVLRARGSDTGWGIAQIAIRTNERGRSLGHHRQDGAH